MGENIDQPTSTPAPEPATLEKLVALGERALDGVRLAAMLYSLREDPFVSSMDALHDFQWLRGLPWADASAVVRAILRLETAQMTKSSGPASAVNSAFRVMEDRDSVTALELAAWIVESTDNALVPFGTGAIRHAFERFKRDAQSWGDCRKKLDQWQRDQRNRRRAAQGPEEQPPKGVRRRKTLPAVAARLRAEQTEILRATDAARKRLLEELSSLPAKARLEHIAWDDTRALDFYPIDLAVCAAEDLEALEPATKRRLMAKLRAHKTGPWQILAKRLAEV